MRGSPVTPIACDAAVTGQAPPFNNNKLFDIRHVSRDENVGKSRCRSSRGGACKEGRNVMRSSVSHESSLSHESAVVKDEGSMVSSEETTTEEPSWIGLELTLGLEPSGARGSHVVVPIKKRKLEKSGTCDDDEDTCKIELGLVCSE